MKPFAIIKKYNIKPNKNLGQNFLIDKNILNKFIELTNISDDDCIIEIGAGFGALTSVLAERACEIIAIEYDEKMFAILNAELKYKNLKLINEDILKIDLKKLIPTGKRIKIFGNLPYYITSKIIFNILEVYDRVDSAVFTMQKEVADRILAKPGSKDYGRLSVSVNLFANIKKLFNINPKSFYPHPKVISSVLKFDFNKEVTCNIKIFQDVLKAVFQERRKYIANGLLNLSLIDLNKNEVEQMLNALKIDAKKRPEDISLEDYLNITEAMG